jgi:penicillin-insensitive murein endopeptidase
MPDYTLSYHERETISAKLMVVDRKHINRRRFTIKHARLIRRAAKYSEVQRIFVHPPIKKYLCDWSANNGEKNRSWLAKVRPYYGHNYHFHIRMRCPSGVSGCRKQPEPRPEDGTGCGKELNYWYSSKPWRPAKPKPGKKPKPRRQLTISGLPRECRMVLRAR